MLSQLINTAERTTIPLERIKTDGGTQMRAALDPETVQEYLDAMQPVGWGDFPVVIVYYDGKDHWLADGFHRVEAYRRAAANLDQPASVPADVRSGTRRDAILHAAGANASHGLRRTNADKRRAVENLLRDDEWRHWSNREIGRRCAVDEGTVRRIRGEMERTAEIPQSEERHGADGRTIDTSNIGTNPAAAKQTGTPLTDAQISEFLAFYWRGAGLQQIADSDDPRGVLRGMIVQSRSGAAGGRWRYQTMSGKVECWDGGEYFTRPADASWTYDQFARLSLRVLPSPSWVQQPDDLDSADVEQRIRAEIDSMYAQPVDADPEIARPQPDFANPSPAKRIENHIDTLAWEARPTSPQARIDHLMDPTNFAYYRDNVRKRTGLEVSGTAITDAMIAVIADTRERNDVDEMPPAISNQDRPLPDWAADDLDPDRPRAQRPLAGKELCTALLGQAIVDVYNLPGSVRLILDNNQTITINGTALSFTIEEA